MTRKFLTIAAGALSALAVAAAPAAAAPRAHAAHDVLNGRVECTAGSVKTAHFPAGAPVHLTVSNELGAVAAGDAIPGPDGIATITYPAMPGFVAHYAAIEATWTADGGGHAGPFYNALAACFAPPVAPPIVPPAPPVPPGPPAPPVPPGCTAYQVSVHVRGHLITATSKVQIVVDGQTLRHKVKRYRAPASAHVILIRYSDGCTTHVKRVVYKRTPPPGLG